MYTLYMYMYVHLCVCNFLCFHGEGGSLVRRDVAHNLMRLIAEGTENEATDMELRQDAVATYIELLDKPHLPDILIKIICWVWIPYVALVAFSLSISLSHTHTQACVHAHTHTHTHTAVHAHIHTVYTCTCTCTFV